MKYWKETNYTVFDSDSARSDQWWITDAVGDKTQQPGWCANPTSTTGNGNGEGWIGDLPLCVMKWDVVGGFEF